MAAFPDLRTGVPALEPLSISLRFKTLINEFDNQGQESAKQKMLYPKRDIDLKFKVDNLANGRALWQFFVACKGRLTPFNLFLPNPDTYVGEYVGLSDNSVTIFNLPSKLAAAYTIYVGTAVQTAGTDYTFTAQGGADGADQIEFAAAPAVGYITIDFTGILKIRSKFADDAMSFTTFYNRLFTTGLKLKGQHNA